MLGDRDVQGGFYINDILVTANDLRPGDRLNIRMKQDKTITFFIATVVDVFDYFINVRVDTEKHGSYVTSINKVDLLMPNSWTRLERVG